MRRNNHSYMKFMDSKHRNKIQTMRRVYRDSVSNYKLMKRLHMDTSVAGMMVLDARRKYRDAEEQGFIAKIKGAFRKLNDKITLIVKSNPLLANLARIWLRTTGAWQGFAGGHNAVKLVQNTIKNLELFKAGWKQNAPATAGTLVGVALGAVIIPLLKAYLKWKLADEIKRRQEDDDIIHDFGVKGMKKGIRRAANAVKAGIKHNPSKIGKAVLAVSGAPVLLAGKLAGA